MKPIKEGKVRMGTLNTACRRILEAKYKLGLFDNPYKYCDVNRPKRDIFTKEHRDVARKIAGESFVLLKNAPATAQPLAAHSSSPVTASPVLPLKKQGTVAVIGPLGNTRSNMPGTWSVAARLNDYPSLYEGLKEMMAGKVNITYAKGSNLIGDAAYEERATMFGRSLNRDNRTDQELLVCSRRPSPSSPRKRTACTGSSSTSAHRPGAVPLYHAHQCVSERVR